MSTLPPSSFEAPHFSDGPHGKIAYHTHQGDPHLPGLVWLGGYRSDMLGSKAEFIHHWAIANNVSFLRFDYSGHGQSEGDFKKGTISQWAKDAHHAINALTTGPQILIGSSMGGWISMLTALNDSLKQSVAGMVLIAPAPDFTQDLMWADLNQEERSKIILEGFIETPSDYSDEPTIITHDLIKDGRQCLVLDKTISLNGPVRILQGMKDVDVPWQHALKAVECFESDDVVATLVKNGDHRLSTDEDLVRLGETLKEITQKIRM